MREANNNLELGHIDGAEYAPLVDYRQVPPHQRHWASKAEAKINAVGTTAPTVVSHAGIVADQRAVNIG